MTDTMKYNTLPSWRIFFDIGKYPFLDKQE